jgi:hypothetical protein
MGVVPSTKYTLACVDGFTCITGFLNGDSLVAVFTLFVGLLARSQYPESPATGQPGIDFP